MILKINDIGNQCSLLHSKQYQKFNLLSENKKEIFRALEAEREKVAEVLQEDIAQLLSIARMRLTGDTAIEVDGYLSSAVKKLRLLAFELKPQILEYFGLATALDQLLIQRLGYAIKLKQLPLNMNGLMESAVFRLLHKILIISPAAGFKNFSLNIVRSGHFIWLKISFITDPTADASFNDKLIEAGKTVKLLFNAHHYFQCFSDGRIEFQVGLDELELC